eukprot:COSAG02_NODE_6528_length_3518_cov_5.108219_1_plen_361_part_00
MGKQSKERGGAGGSIYEAGPAGLGSTARTLLELCTADGEEKPTEDKLGELFEVMRFASSEECVAIGEWFEKRLGHSSVDVKVKAILLMNDAVRLGHKPLHAALGSTCVKVLEQLGSFKGNPHPVHGELPNRMVRNRSAKLVTTLKGPPPASPSAGLGLGGLLLGLICIVLAVVAALHQNHGSPKLVWYRTQRHADRFLQSASDTLFGPAPPPQQHNDTVEHNSRLDPVEPFVPGKEADVNADVPSASQKLSSADTFAALQAAFDFFDDGENQRGVDALDENHQTVLQAHLAGDLTREEFEGYMNKAVSKRVVSGVLDMMRHKDLGDPEHAGATCASLETKIAESLYEVAFSLVHALCVAF